MLLPRHQSELPGPNSVILPLAEKDCRFNIELVWDPDNRNIYRGVFLDEFRQFSRNLRDLEVPMRGLDAAYDRISDELTSATPEPVDLAKSGRASDAFARTKSY